VEEDDEEDIGKGKGSRTQEISGKEQSERG
jgi:hypothetical protein